MAMNLLQRLIYPVIKTPAEKMNYIHSKAYLHYYTQLKEQEKKLRSRDSITIPYFVIEENLKEIAFKKANNDLADVIRDCRINECYKKALKA